MFDRSKGLRGSSALRGQPSRGAGAGRRGASPTDGDPVGAADRTQMRDGRSVARRGRRGRGVRARRPAADRATWPASRDDEPARGPARQADGPAIVPATPSPRMRARSRAARVRRRGRPRVRIAARRPARSPACRGRRACRRGRRRRPRRARRRARRARGGTGPAPGRRLHEHGDPATPRSAGRRVGRAPFPTAGGRPRAHAVAAELRRRRAAMRRRRRVRCSDPARAGPVRGTGSDAPRATTGGAPRVMARPPGRRITSRRIDLAASKRRTLVRRRRPASLRPSRSSPSPPPTTPATTPTARGVRASAQATGSRRSPARRPA